MTAVFSLLKLSINCGYVVIATNFSSSTLYVWGGWPIYLVVWVD